MKTLLITANSITIELDNKTPYKRNKYSVILNGKVIFEDERNVISLYDLKPNTNYSLEIDNDKLEFKTLDKKLVRFIKSYDSIDDTKYIQEAIDNLLPNETLMLDSKYNVRCLYIGSNKSIYLAKEAIILGSTKREEYDIFKENEDLNNRPLGTWEGRRDDAFASIINFLGSKDSVIYGPGVVDCNANNSDWWIDHRTKRIARRPKGIFIHTSDNITLEGIKVCNTPSWNQHAFYSKNINYLNMRLENPWDSPTTDGCDPEACDMVNIIGNIISVGDDCIAIKSSKIELASIYHTPSKNIIIRNNFMKHGHAGVTLGSENSGGINNISVSQCIFNGTDRGLRIKSQRGRGKDAVISNILFDNIYMDHVKSPFVINAFYKAGNDIDDYRFIYDYMPKTDLTPTLGDFTFQNIKCDNVCYGVGYFQGLPESFIKSVTLKNVRITYDYDTQPGAMGYEKINPMFKNIGFFLNNIEKLVLDNVSFLDSPSEKFVNKNCDNIIIK